MKPLHRILLLVLIVLLSSVPAVQAQAPSDPEIKQIVAAAKNYAKPHGGTEDIFGYKFIRKVNNYALVQNYPKPPYTHNYEGASIVLKKVGGKWVGQDMGTGLEEDWNEKVPGLFK